MERKRGFGLGAACGLLVGLALMAVAQPYGGGYYAEPNAMGEPRLVGVAVERFRENGEPFVVRLWSDGKLEVNDIQNLWGISQYWIGWKQVTD